MRGVRTKGTKLAIIRKKPLKSVLFKHCFIVFRNYGYKESGFFFAGLTKDEKWVLGKQ